jgi:hypothetical protein
VTLAVRDNELRVEYLGGSVRQAMAVNFVLAAFCGGLGGALVVMSLGHIEPNFSLLDDLGRVRLRRHPRRLAERARGVRRVHRAGGGALVLQRLLPQHLAARAGLVPAVRDPLPAARHRLAVDQAERAMSVVLSARGLGKRFGAVVAAADITSTSPPASASA